MRIKSKDSLEKEDEKITLKTRPTLDHPVYQSNEQHQELLEALVEYCYGGWYKRVYRAEDL